MDIPRLFLAATALFLAISLLQWLAKYLAHRTLGGRPTGKEAVTLQKRFVKAAKLLGDKKDKEKVKGAIRELASAVEIDPKDPTVRSLKAIAHESVGDINGCLRELDAAIENYRRLPYNDRAQVYAKRGQVLVHWKKKYDHAIVDFETSLTFNKKDANVIAMLAACYERKKQWATARDLYKEALKQDRRSEAVKDALKRLDGKGADEPWGSVQEDEAPLLEL